MLVLAGPRSREVMQALTDIDLSTAAFPWLSGKHDLASGRSGALALRVNFIGELGWEMHHPIETQNYMFDRLMAAGQAFGIKPFGIRAMDSMRLEKSYKLVARELSIEYAAFESGLDRFIDLKKNSGFLGRDALLARQAKGFANRFVTLAVDGVTDADARGSEPIFRGDDIVGRTTSGGYGWRVGRSLALGMVRPDIGDIGSELDIVILGERHRATVIPDSPYDPDNASLRQ